MTQAKGTRTWHHGLVAQWWAEFNHGGDDIDVFRQEIAGSGEPVLDAGCGTGRLLLPLLRDGVDIDGSDASPDMLDWCRRQLDSQELSTNLYCLAMHELDLPRQYQTVAVCGAFGLGGSREQDLQGLRHIHQLLQPGGSLVMDHYLPNLENPKSWRDWVEAPDLPRDWPARGDRRQASDGSELEIRVRQLAFDPLEQFTTLEMRAARYREGEEVAVETSVIDINLYLMKEIEWMLALAGFRDVEVFAFGEARRPAPWQDARILFRASA